MKSIVYLLSGLGFVCLLGASCFALPTQPQATAQAGRITVYTSLNLEEAHAYLADFAIAYPEVEVDLLRESAEALLVRLLAERANPQADVVWGFPLTSMLLLEWNDVLRPYAPLGLERVSPAYRDTRKPPYWVGDHLVIAGLCVNADLVGQRGVPVPSSWQDLLNPVYRRNLVMPNPVTSGTGFMLVVGILERYGEQDGWRYLDELHKNIALYTERGEDACHLVDRNEYPIGLARRYEGLANVQMIYPNEGSGWDLMSSALVRKRTLHPASKTFLDWAISETAMRLYARRSGITAVETGLSTPLGFPADPEAQLLDIDIPWAAANLNRILAEWERRYSDKTADSQ